MFQRSSVGEEPLGRAFTIRIGPKLTFMLALGDETSEVEKSTNTSGLQTHGGRVRPVRNY